VLTGTLLEAGEDPPELELCGGEAELLALAEALGVPEL